MSDYMTGAELQTLREGCGLSREDLAGLCGVQARTVKHWENGRSGVPADVAGVVAAIEARLWLAAREAKQAITEAARQHGSAPADVVLIRYASSEDLARYRPDMAGLPVGVHGALVGRVRMMLTEAPGFVLVPVRIVWMHSEEYQAWRSAQGMDDSEATRAAWAAGQVDKQAAAHRADQPPAHAGGAAGGGMA